MPGYEASAWFGMGAPKNTPPEIIAKLNKAVNEALADPEMKAKLADLGGIRHARHARGLRQGDRGRNGEVGEGGEVLGASID